MWSQKSGGAHYGCGGGLIGPSENINGTMG